MAKLQVELISDGMAELLREDGVRAFVAAQADQALDRALASAPVRTGAYKAGIRRESVTTDRAVERVVATAPHSMAVEAMTGTLARALGDGSAGAGNGSVMYITRSGRRRRATAAQAAAWKASRKAP